MSDIVFPEGMIVKKDDRSPDFVIAKVSIRVGEFIPWLEAHAQNGWVNLDMLTSKAGKPYAKLDNWKPSGDPQKAANVMGASSAPNDEIPFAKAPSW